MAIREVTAALEPHGLKRAGEGRCSFPSCAGHMAAHGLCDGHYRQYRKGRVLSELGSFVPAKSDPGLRFWAAVDKDGPTIRVGIGPCWIWTKSTSSFGYGRFARGTGDVVRAHRFAYELEYGPITDGLFVCHRCDNPPCVRVAHLFVGTPSDNMRDCFDKGRGRSLLTESLAAQTSCKHGHAFKGANLGITKGKRYCKECHKARARSRYDELRSAINGSP